MYKWWALILRLVGAKEVAKIQIVTLVEDLLVRKIISKVYDLDPLNVCHIFKDASIPPFTLLISRIGHGFYQKGN